MNLLRDSLRITPEERTIINELGQIVPALGNPLSPARIKAQFPETFAELLRATRDTLHLTFIDNEDKLEREKDIFEYYMKVCLPAADTAIVSAFWRALQCEQDIINLHKK